MLSQKDSNQTIPTPGKKSRWLLILLLVTCLATVTSGYWLLTSASGLQWLLSMVSRSSAGSLSFEGVNGTMRAMHIKEIHFTGPELKVAVRDAELVWQPSALLSGKLLVKALSAQDIEVLSLPSQTPEPTTLPESLRLPLSVSLHELNIATLRVFTKEGGTPDFAATKLSAQLKSDGQQHHLSNLSIKLDFGILTAAAKIDGDQPFALTAQARLADQTELSATPSSKTDILATVTGSLEQLDLKVKGQGAGMHGDADAQLLPFATLPITDLRLSIDGLNPLVLSPDAPKANLMIHANFHEKSVGKLVGNLMVKNSMVAPLDDGGLPLHEINTQVALSTELLQLNNISLRLADKGVISGNAVWRIEQLTGLADLTVNQLNPLALDTRLRVAQINGSIKLKGDAETQHGVIALKDETLRLNAKVTRAVETIALENLQLSRGQSQLSGHGKLDLANQQSFNFEGKLKHFNLSDFLQAPDSDLNTSLKLAGNLAPQIAGIASFKIENSQLAKQPVAGNGQIKFNGLKQLKSEVELRVGSNHLHAMGSLGKPNDSMQVEITAPALAQIGLGLDGALNINARLGGSLKSPKVKFEIDGKNLGLSDHHLTRIAANGNLDDEAISLNINADDYRTEKETQLQSLDISVTGKKSEHAMRTKVQVNDKLEVELQATGELAKSSRTDPALKWIGNLSQLSVTGPLPLRLLAPASLELSSERVSLGLSRFEIASGQANIVDTQWTPQTWSTQGNFTGIVLHPDGAPAKKQEALHLGGNWDITSADQLAGHLQIAREKGDLIVPGDSPFPLGLQTLQFNARAESGQLSGKLSIKGQYLGKTSASITLPLTASGASWAILPNAPINGEVAINIDDLSWIGPILDENIKSDGQFDLQASIAGTFGKPELQGKVSGENLTLMLLDQGLQLQQGKLAANFDQSSLYINALNFSSPFVSPPRDRLLGSLELPEKPGTLAISGVIGLLGDVINLKIGLDHLPLAHPPDYWIVFSGNNHIELGDNTLALSGKITADAGLLSQPPAGRPQLADDIIVGEKPQADTQKKPLLKLDATLDMGKHFYLRAAGLEGRLAGQLRLQNDARQNLKVTGSIVTRNTTFKAYGQNLTVQRGIVNFQGPLDDPGLNVLAVREGLPVEAGVEVTGTVRRPQVQLVSTPTVPDLEKLSWIVLGRAPHSGGLDTSLLLTAAGSILGGEGGGITDQISDALGVDEISIRQGKLDAGAGANTGNNPLTSQIGTVGKRLSSRAYISYERGLTTATAGVTKLTYSLTPRINIVTRAGEDSAIDLFYTFQFD